MQGERSRYLDSPYIVSQALSPDGRWMAYASNESGQFRVYVQSYPIPGERWLVSPENGIAPVWASGGRELFYRSVSGSRIMVVDVTVEDSILRTSTPRILHDGLTQPDGVRRSGYDVSTDGQRVVMVTEVQDPEPATPQTTLILVEHWFEDLRRLATAE